MTRNDPFDLAVADARAADDKGGTDILVLDVSKIVGIVGWFVVVSASNPRLVGAVTEAIEEKVREGYGESPRYVEGAAERRWVLLDYADMVVHVFLGEERDFYRIERLYSDAPIAEWRPADHPSHD